MTLSANFISWWPNCQQTSSNPADKVPSAFSQIKMRMARMVSCTVYSEKNYIQKVVFLFMFTILSLINQLSDSVNPELFTGSLLDLSHVYLHVPGLFPSQLKNAFEVL